MPIIGEIRSFGFGTAEAISSDLKFYELYLRPKGWLECNGQSLPILQFRRLFRVIGHNWGSKDRPNSFNLPDLRGLFLRGWNHDSARDPDADGRVGIHPVDAPGDFEGATQDNVGSYQADELKRHSHSLGYKRHGLKDGSYDWNLQTGGPHVSTAPTGGNETRPKNAYVMYCIWSGREISASVHDLQELEPDADLD